MEHFSEAAVFCTFPFPDTNVNVHKNKIQQHYELPHAFEDGRAYMPIWKCVSTQIMPKDSETWTIFLSSAPCRSRPRLSVSLSTTSLVDKNTFLGATWQNLWPKDGLGSLASATTIHLLKKEEEKMKELIFLLTPCKGCVAFCTLCVLFGQSLGEQEWVLYLKGYVTRLSTSPEGHFTQIGYFSWRLKFIKLSFTWWVVVMMMMMMMMMVMIMMMTLLVAGGAENIVEACCSISRDWSHICKSDTDCAGQYYT